MRSRGEADARRREKTRNNIIPYGHAPTGSSMPLTDILREAEKLEITPGMKLKWSDKLNKMVWEKE